MSRACPQLEDGYTKIANELLDVFASTNLSGREWQILFCLIRKTYGFNKKIDGISLSQFSKATKIKSNHCAFVLNKLIDKKIIKKEQYLNRYSLNRYSLNKEYLNWYSGSTQIGTNKRNYYKRNNNTQSKIASKTKNMETIELDELGEPITRKDTKKTFGKYPARIAKYYCELVGKNSASRQLPASKELMQLAQQDFPDDSMEEWFTEIKGRIKVAQKYYSLNNISDWNLSKIAENWQKILKEWNNKIK